MKRKINWFAAIILIVILSLTLFACDITYVPLYSNPASENGVNYSADASISLSTIAEDAQVLSWPDIAEMLIPSVVCVYNYSDTLGESLASTGSGVVMCVNGEYTYIVTNAHVVEKQASLKIMLYDETVLSAELVGSDSYTDLAVIRVNVTNLKVAVFGNSDELRAGEDVMAIGNPGGDEFMSSVTKGCVSAVNRELSLTNGYRITCIQTDAAINPGNSGGALINQYGQVVGINSAKISATGYESMGFAIATTEMLPIVNSLMSTGTVQGRASLGLTGYEVSSPEVGFRVSAINSAKLSEGGLQVGDIILKIDDTRITGSDMMFAQLQNKAIGDKVTLTIYRYQVISNGGPFSRPTYSGEELVITVELVDYNTIKD